MKKGLFLLLALLAGMTVAQAQGNGRAADRYQQGRENMDAYFKEIGVTDAQMTQIEESRTEMQKEMQAIREEGRSPETREKLEALRDEHDAKMKSILNEEQYSKYLAKREEARKHAGSRGKSRYNKPDTPN